MVIEADVHIGPNNQLVTNFNFYCNLRAQGPYTHTHTHYENITSITIQ